MCTSSMTGSATGSMRNGEARSRSLWGRTGFVMFGMLASISMMGLEAKALNILRVDDSSTCTTVDDPCTGSLACGEATNWSDAFKKLEDAIAQAVICGDIDEIWVAEITSPAGGSYKPAASSGSRTASFELLDGVELYGGFDGTETARSERDFVNNVTILSGDLNGNDSGFTNNDENSYHVLTYSDASATGVVLDGFTITGGNADGSGAAQDQGSGLHIRRTDLLCQDMNGSTGGPGTSVGDTCTVATEAADCDTTAGEKCVPAMCIAGGPTIRNCIFIGNSADNHGTVNDHSFATIYENVTFQDNIASKGAGLLVQHGSPTLTDCVFDGNETNASPHEGGGAWFGHKDVAFHATCTATGNSEPTIDGCTFTDNLTQNEGAGAWFKDSTFEMSDSHFIGNKVCSSTTTSCRVFAAGGAIWMAGSGSNGAESTITNCTFVGNEADDKQAGFYGNSGALNIVSSWVDITNSSFIDNIGLYTAGAIWNQGTGAMSLINCIFSGNKTTKSGAGFGFGGALYVNSDSKSEITNCTFWENLAEGEGGAIWVNTDLDIVNSIFWGNKDTSMNNDDAEAQIFISTNLGTPDINITKSDIMDDDPGTGCSDPCEDNCEFDTLCTGIENIDDEPDFFDTDDLDGDDNEYGTSDDGLVLLSSSTTLIDEGYNDGVTRSEDLAGNCRIENDTVDMGAYEYCGGSCDAVVVCDSVYCACDEFCCSGACEECCVDDDCSEVDTPACENTTSYTCVECTSTNDDYCTGGTPECNTSTNTCVECTNNGHCNDPGKDFCYNNICVQCLDDGDCILQIQICNSRNECVFGGGGGG